MKKIFTLVLVMAMAITSFAQVKSMSRKSVKHEAQKMYSFKGFESLESSYVASPRNMMIAPEEVELSQTYYDWQSNSGARNFTAVWPDGYAVMCYTQASNASYSDRGTGLAIWDPAVGEWEYTEHRVEGVKTGFGSIARYGENGLVVAAHCANDCRIFIVEDFREGNRDFGEGIILPMAEGVDATHPAVQCSGENLDIVHILAANFQADEPYYPEAIFYWRYENEAFTHECELLPSLDQDHVRDGGTNSYYFMRYTNDKRDRVAFVLNTSWADGKVVVSEDNGDTWEERIFFQHPNIHADSLDVFFYPRWTSAVFDEEDNIHLAYEYNGTSGAPGDDGYYPGVGGIGYWSEILPKNDSCVGGIGNVGEPFIMDTTYISQDLYYSEWYWSDALHQPLPEYIGELEMVDDNGFVLDRNNPTGNWVQSDLWKEHGAYNCGKAAFPSMYKDGERIFVFWSMIAGDGESQYINAGTLFFRLFCNISLDGGNTWLGTRQVLKAFENKFDEMVYGQVIPFVYNDADGDYLWYCYQNDGAAGTFVQSDDANGADNYYHAVKVYVEFMMDDVEDNLVAVAQEVNVYPNPAQGSFSVRLDSASDINIFNTVGQLVKTFNNVKEVNVNLESGVYFVNVDRQTVKVVVK